MNDLTRFKISETQYLKINPESIGVNECKFCANIDIVYVDEERNTYIQFGYEHFPSFCYFIAKYDRIKKLIKGEMVLDSSAAKKLGIEWNEYFEGIIKDTDVGEYHFFGNSHKQIRPYFDGWMYNDENGNIIFEITPSYPWSDPKQKSHPDKISFKQFMKDYKPVIKTMIPKENLKQWIKQAEMLDKMLKCEDDQCD